MGVRSAGRKHFSKTVWPQLCAECKSKEEQLPPLPTLGLGNMGKNFIRIIYFNISQYQNISPYKTNHYFC